MTSVLTHKINIRCDPELGRSDELLELQASRALLQMARHFDGDGPSDPDPCKSVLSEQMSQSTDEETCGHDAEKPDDDDHDILDVAEKTGRLLCAVFHRNVCTICEKDLVSKKYFTGNSTTALSASKLVRLHGPKGGAGSRNDDAIFIRPPNIQAQRLHRADLHTHGEWYIRYSEDMYRIERRWQTGKQTSTGRKRKAQTETEAEATQEDQGHTIPTEEAIATNQNTQSQSIRAEEPASKKENTTIQTPDEGLPVGFHELKVETQIEWIRARDNAAKYVAEENAAKYLTEAWKAYVSNIKSSRFGS